MFETIWKIRAVHGYTIYAAYIHAYYRIIVYIVRIPGMHMVRHFISQLCLGQPGSEWTRFTSWTGTSRQSKQPPASPTNLVGHSQGIETQLGFYKEYLEKSWTRESSCSETGQVASCTLAERLLKTTLWNPSFDPHMGAGDGRLVCDSRGVFGAKDGSRGSNPSSMGCRWIEHLSMEFAL